MKDRYEILTTRYFNLDKHSPKYNGQYCCVQISIDHEENKLIYFHKSHWNSSYDLKEENTILYVDDAFMLVKNEEENVYHFGCKNDFICAWGIPVNQCCLTLEECENRLKSFIRIDEKYLGVLGKYAEENIKRWQDMIDALKVVSK